MGARESTEFAGYRVYGAIAAGGMASVHLAQRDGEPDGRYLALKRVHPHLAAREDVRRMFLNEAQILTRLAHPNVCGITDYGIHDDAPYLVMQYLHGAPLSGLLRRLLDLKRPLPIDLMTYVIASVCEGLHYAHEALGDDGRSLELVHRDISPQNIYVTFSGAVKLLDFGVAKAAGYESFTRTGHIKGKYAYMSPEQAAGNPLDRRSDVFSLGIVLWESLTGRHLFKRTREIDTLHAIAAGVVPVPSKINPAVPPALDRILKRTLQARRGRRYQTASDLGKQLWGYLTGAPRPMGSDEVAEILADVFAGHPDPAAQANRMITQPDAKPITTSTGRLPLEDLDESIIEEATLAAQKALDADTEDHDEPEEDILEAPTGESDVPDVPDVDTDDGLDGEITHPPVVDPDSTPRYGEEVAPVDSDTGDLRVRTELADDATPRQGQPLAPVDNDTGDLRMETEIAPSPATGSGTDDLDLLTNISPDDEVPELIPWHAEEANQAPTIADPLLSDEVRQAIEALATDGADPADPTEGVNLSFLDRPMVQPHPFDRGPGFEAEQQVTVMDDGKPPAGAAKVVTTVPKQEISDLPPELPDDGPRIEPPPPSLMDDPRPPTPQPEADLTETPAPSGEPSRRPLLWIGAALLIIAAVLVGLLIVQNSSEVDLAPAPEAPTQTP